MKQSLRLLVVEDDDDVREALAMLLDALGHESREAEGIAQARTLIEEGGTFDAVLSDTRLGNSQTGGVDMGWNLMSLYRSHGIPCIGMSAQEVGATWMRHGAIGFLLKPASLEDITAMLVSITEQA